MKTILVPEAGGEVGTDFVDHYMSQDKDNNKGVDNEGDIKLVVVDAQDHIAVQYLAEVFYQIPPYDDKKFMEVISDIIEREEVDMLAPTFEHGLSLWEKITEKYGLHCVVDIPTAKLFKDKYQTYRWCEKYGIDTIPTVTVPKYSGAGKWYVKPRFGAGSKHNFAGQGKLQYDALVQYLQFSDEEYIMQPFCEGAHWSVDTVKMGDAIIVIPKKGMFVRGSKIISTCVVWESRVMHAARKILQTIEADGIYNIELIEQGKTLYLLEINTRLAGGTGYSIKAGFDLYRFAITDDEEEKKVMIAEFTEQVSKHRLKNLRIWYKQRVIKSDYAITGVKGLVINSEGDQPKVLLAKRKDVPYWTLPGGHLDQGESPEEALERELQEEFDGDLIVSKPQKFTEIMQHGIYSRKYVIYWMEYIKGLYERRIGKNRPDRYGQKVRKKKILRNKEVAKWCFFKTTELPELLDQSTRTLIEEFFDKDLSYHNLSRSDAVTKQVRIDYKKEVKTLLKKPLRGMYVMGKILWNQIFSGSFKL